MDALSSRKQFWEAFCILLEFLVETSLLSPKGEKHTPPIALLLLFLLSLPLGHPQVLNLKLCSQRIPKIRQLRNSQNLARTPQLGISWISYTREGGSRIKKVFTATGNYFMDKPKVQWGQTGTHSFIQPTAGKARSCVAIAQAIMMRTWMGHWEEPPNPESSKTISFCGQNCAVQMKKSGPVPEKVRPFIDVAAETRPGACRYTCLSWGPCLVPRAVSGGKSAWESRGPCARPVPPTEMRCQPAKHNSCG